MRIFVIILVALLSNLTLAIPYITFSDKKRKKCFRVQHTQQMILDVHYEFFGVPQGREVKDQIKIMFDDQNTDDQDIYFLKESSGRHQYTSSSDSVDLNICIHAQYLKDSVALLSLRFAESFPKDHHVLGDDYYDYEKANESSEQIKKDETASEKKKKDETASEEKQEKTRTHLLALEKMVKGMISEAESLLSAANLIKKNEADFFQQSIKMNSSASWWPIFHLVVLIVTGFAQATHMVNFFKSRHF